MREFVLATRGSALALRQAEIVKNALLENGAKVIISTVSTKGDKDRKTPLSVIGGSGLFVREIEKELCEKRADIAVHSAKDLPYRLKDGLEIAATPKAASFNDCLITRKGETLKENCVIGTGSARRISEAEKLFPKALFSNIRGNVDTRLKKLLFGEYDAIILAKAGLDRLGADLSCFDVKIFEKDEFIPAACQGIIACECRSDDEEAKAVLSKVSDCGTMKRFSAERYMLSLLQADCSCAMGVHCSVDGEQTEICAMFKGKKAKEQGLYSDYENLCRKIKDEIYE